MKAIAAFACGIAVTALVLPVTQVVYEHVTEIETVHVPVDRPVLHDYEQLLNVLRQPEPSGADAQADYECVLGLERLTSDPIAGIALYVGKYYDGDACAAYMHQVLHDWY